MESRIALTAFAALSQDTRLAIFRRLIGAGPDGLAAGMLAQELSVPPSTLSAHLSILEQAGLITSSRLHRNIFYAADITGIRALIDFLMMDCCNGNPELCGIANVSGRAIKDCK